jgi:hypothetical protein
MIESNSFSNLTERLSSRLNSRKNSRHAKKILASIQKMERQAAALDKIRNAKNPVDTEAGHSRKIAVVAKKLQAETAKAKAEANDFYASGLAEINTAILSRTGLVETGHAAEIRAAFRTMTGKQRSDTLNTALSEGNSEIIAAVSLVPPILSGVTDEAQKRYIMLLQHAKAADLVEERDDLSDAIETAEAAHKLAGIIFDQNYDPQKQAAIDRAERQTREAESELAESMAG